MGSGDFGRIGGLREYANLSLPAGLSPLSQLPAMGMKSPIHDLGRLGGIPANPGVPGTPLQQLAYMLQKLAGNKGTEEYLKQLKQKAIGAKDTERGPAEMLKLQMQMQQQQVLQQLLSNLLAKYNELNKQMVANIRA